MKERGKRRKAGGIIFDLDGTLVDSIEDISVAANKALRTHGYPEHGVTDFLSWIGNGAARLIEAALPVDVDRESFERTLSEFKRNYRLNLHEKTSLYEGIPELLDQLSQQGSVMSILSNKPHEMTVEVVNWYLPKWHFFSVYGQRDGIPRKPDPAAAIQMAGDMGIQASEIMFVGDSANDMATARAGGFIPVGVLWGYGSESCLVESGAEYLLRKPEQLMDILLKIQRNT